MSERLGGSIPLEKLPCDPENLEFFVFDKGKITPETIEKLKQFCKYAQFDQWGSTVYLKSDSTVGYCIQCIFGVEP